MLIFKAGDFSGQLSVVRFQALPLILKNCSVPLQVCKSALSCCQAVSMLPLQICSSLVRSSNGLAQLSNLLIVCYLMRCQRCSSLTRFNACEA